MDLRLPNKTQNTYQEQKGQALKTSIVLIKIRISEF